MKKLIAILLAVLLLGSITAYAENAKALSVSDLVLDVTADGEPTHIDLSGLTLKLAILGEEGQPALALNVFGDGKLLFNAGIVVADGRVAFTADGLSHSYSAALPEEVPVEMPSVSVDPEVAQEIAQILMTGIELEDADGVMNFRIPYTTVNELIDKIVPIVQENASGADLSEMLDAIEQMKAADGGFELSGTVNTSDPEAISGELRVTVVDGGVADESPVALLGFTGSMAGEEMSFHIEFFAGDRGAALEKVATMELRLGDALVLEITVDDTLILLSFTPETGALALGVRDEDFELNFGATVKVGEDEIAVCAVDTAGALDIESLGDAELEALQNELMTAASGLIGYLLPVIMQIG